MWQKIALFQIETGMEKLQTCNQWKIEISIFFTGIGLTPNVSIQHHSQEHST